MLECLMPVNKENAEDYSPDAYIQVRVDQNNCVGETAQKYLNLCGCLDKGVLSKNELTKKVSLPADLMAVEQGVAVLCNAYDRALKAKETDVCDDIEKELKKMSGFYQEKMTEAYFSACNMFFDANGMDKKEVNLLVKSCNSLKDVYEHWPVAENKSDLLEFFEKVDTYSRVFDLENPISNTKKVGNKTSDRYFDFVSHQRTL